ncbi:hypothetical protein D1872_305180 [compost metagenome]
MGQPANLAGVNRQRRNPPLPALPEAVVDTAVADQKQDFPCGVRRQRLDLLPDQLGNDRIVVDRIAKKHASGTAETFHVGLLLRRVLHT